MKFVCLRYPKLQMTYKTEIKREINGEIIKEPTQNLQFNEGTYETDDPKKIAFIKKHSGFNVYIKESEEDRVQENVEPTKEEMAIIEKAIKRGRPKKVVDA